VIPSTNVRLEYVDDPIDELDPDPTLPRDEVLGPWGVEPPQDVVVPYSDPLTGYLAFGVVLALIASVVAKRVYRKAT
jgi:hypothetical protein